MSFLHNQVITVGDRNPAHVNLPPNFDVILQVLPECVNFEESNMSLSFQASAVDFGTGSLAQFMIRPKATMVGELVAQSFERSQYNALLDFTFLSEGRYLSFWTSNMSMSFSPLCYAVPFFPSLEGVDTLFTTDELGQQRLWFYALNWGQKPLYDSSKRLLAIYTKGYKFCYWTKVIGTAFTDDPRVLKVNIGHVLPEIPINDIDIITDFVYVHRNADEAPFEYITSDITNAPIGFEEDAMHAYDPWTEMPKIYPVV